MATITFQNLFRLYKTLSGMTGTAATEAEEFSKIYNLEVVEIPTNKPVARIDAQDRIFKNEQGKFLALARDVKAFQEKGQPVLIGTVSVERNEMLSQLFSKMGIQHEVLNAKNHSREGEIIAQAGRKGSVTIATNMAGRGVDIKLGGNPSTPEQEAEVKALGGLCVLGTERHDARRIDNQLRGRSGRQGDPGYTQFYLSMEDSLMRIFGSDRAKGMLDRLGIPDDQPIEAKLITNSIEKAQIRVEGHHFDSRKHVLEYDDVLNKHREIIYARRREILDVFESAPVNLRERILDIVEGEVEQLVLFHSSEIGESAWDVKEIIESVSTIIQLTDEQKSELAVVGATAVQDKEELAQGRTIMIEAIMKLIRDQYDRLSDVFEDAKQLQMIEKGVLLRSIDMLWIDHLAAMTALRTGIGLQGYGQRDPLVEYKKEGFNLFQQLLGSINAEVSNTFFKYAKHAVDVKVQTQLETSVFQKAGITLQGPAKTSGPAPSGSVGRSEEKVGRNEPCPCGSGKKFKKCHG